MIPLHEVRKYTFHVAPSSGNLGYAHEPNYWWNLWNHIRRMITYNGITEGIQEKLLGDPLKKFLMILAEFCTTGWILMHYVPIIILLLTEYFPQKKLNRSRSISGKKSWIRSRRNLCITWYSRMNPWKNSRRYVEITSTNSWVQFVEEFLENPVTFR